MPVLQLTLLTKLLPFFLAHIININLLKISTMVIPALVALLSTAPLMMIMSLNTVK